MLWLTQLWCTITISHEDAEEATRVLSEHHNDADNVFNNWFSGPLSQFDNIVVSCPISQSSGTSPFQTQCSLLSIVIDGSRPYLVLQSLCLDWPTSTKWRCILLPESHSIELSFSRRSVLILLAYRGSGTPHWLYQLCHSLWKNRRSHQKGLNVVHTQDRLGENWRVLCQPHWMTFWSQLLVKARKMGQDDFDHISLSSLNFCKAKFIHRGGGRAAADKGKVDWSLQTRYKCHCHHHTQPLLSLVWK